MMLWLLGGVGASIPISSLMECKSSYTGVVRSMCTLIPKNIFEKKQKWSLIVGR